MTPQGMLGNQTSPSASPNIYNQVSSAGMVDREQGESELPKSESLVDKATKEFGGVFENFVNLTKSYPGLDKEAQIVKDAMANWFNAAVNRINEGGGSSNY